MIALTLMSNSPGEVTTFVRPVAAELRARYPKVKLRVALVPCPYATGAEASVVREWGLVDEVWSPWETARRWCLKECRDQAAVLFLGGDPWHALVWKQRFGIPVLGYFPQPSGWITTDWLGGFDRLTLGFGSSETPGWVGDLRVDAVRSALPSREDTALTLALFPGSRWLHLKASLGPFLHVVERLQRRRPELRVLLSVSPFVTPQRLADAAAKPLTFGLSVASGQVQGSRLVTAGGAAIDLVWAQPHRVIAECDLALSLPGTNTAELAIAGKPAVVPVSDLVPVGGGGLLGLIDRWLGWSPLQHYLRHRKYRRLQFVSLPNQLAGREVFPEPWVQPDLENLVDRVDGLLDDGEERRRVGQQACQVMGPPGAAGRVVEALSDLLSWVDRPRV